MTIEEIEQLKEKVARIALSLPLDATEDYDNACKILEALVELIALKKKEMPIKPIEKEDEFGDRWETCPNCKETLVFTRSKNKKYVAFGADKKFYGNRGMKYDKRN